MMKTSCNCLLKVIGLVIHFRIMPISCLTIKFFWLVFVLIYLCNYNYYIATNFIQNPISHTYRLHRMRFNNNVA